MTELNAEVLATELARVKDVLNVTCSKLMVATQTVHELLKGHMDLRAALTLAQTDKSGLEDFVKNLLNPPVPEVAPVAPEATPEVPATEAPVADANTVQA